jgi:tRNA wybutosine-synthesizing protein 2
MTKLKFKDKLVERLADEFTPEELKLLPAGFQTLDDVAIINLKPELLPKKEVIAQALLDILPYIKSVWGKVFGQSKVVGQFRTPTGLIHILGPEKSEITLIENGVKFTFDFTQIIFSKGNIHERSYLPKLVQTGEIILDMFAGIGYFSLMIAKHAEPARIHACEINPVSYNFLIQNIEANHVGDIITPHFGDCGEIAPALAVEGLKADRIIMGVFPAPKEYLPSAFACVNNKTGTVIHYEGTVENKDIDPLLQHIKDAVEVSDIVHEFELQETRFVKNVGINEQHAVLDVFVR